MTLSFTQERNQSVWLRVSSSNTSSARPVKIHPIIFAARFILKGVTNIKMQLPFAVAVGHRSCQVDAYRTNGRRETESPTRRKAQVLKTEIAELRPYIARIGKYHHAEGAKKAEARFQTDLD